MDLLKDNVQKIYIRYLAAAFGSALITSVYSVVDMAMAGQYQGPDGTAALAVVAPVWNVIYSLGLLTGIGGSVLFSMRRGQRTGENGSENEYFTVAAGFSAVLAVFTWAVILLFEKPILTFFGADETLLPMAVAYLKPVLFVFPAFLLNQMLAAFLRNDNNPGLATAGVLAGGVFNMIGDYVFVFTFDLGIFGAGLATAIGSVLSLAVMLTHFFSKKNTLKLVKIGNPLQKVREITVTGFSTFFIDVAMGILTILFNRQIMRFWEATPWPSTAPSSTSAPSSSAAPTAWARPPSPSSPPTTEPEKAAASGKPCAAPSTPPPFSVSSGLHLASPARTCTSVSS